MAHFMCIISSTKTGTHQQTTKENKIHTTKSLFNGIQTNRKKKLRILRGITSHCMLAATVCSETETEKEKKKENNFKCGRGIHDLIKK